MGGALDVRTTEPRIDGEGVEIDEWTSLPLWEGERVDWNYVLGVLLN